ncbi:MAG: spermidine synthase [Acidobacteriota bacterium]|jgi:spermidine synthase|nr:spermidine synthase [Acidobacteriota bacterium]
MRRARQTAPAPAVPARTSRSLLLGTVFFTNLLSLSCQVLWLRKISYLFGSTAFVFSTVLSIFLLGLAVGALWGGRVADRSERPWRLLGWLQIFLGAWVVVSLPIFELGRKLFLAASPSDLAPLPSALAKLAVVLVCMIAPTLAIGAVFPLAVRLAAREPGRLGHDLSLVYGLDTLGAALGSLLAGFFLVPQCGLSASTWILGIGAIDLGVFILLRKREGRALRKKERKARRGAVTVPEPAAEVSTSATASAARLRIVLVTFFFSGGAALLLETGWNRFFSLLNGTHVFSTSTVLAGFLTGIGLGSLLMSRWIDRIRDPYAAVAWLYALVALAGMAVFRTAEPFARAYFRIFQWSSGYNPFQLSVCLVILLIVFLATLAMGANFPLVARIVTRSSSERGAAAGRAFFANTLGSVAGAFLAEFVLLPAWGFTGLMTVTLTIYALGAAVFLAMSPGSPGPRRWVPAAAVAALLAGAVALSPAVLPFEAPFHALYYHGLRLGNWTDYEAEVHTLKVVDEKQGFYGQVAVVRLGPDLLLKHNGKTDASTAVKDNRTQLLLGHLPLLFHPNPRRVLNIGLGGGFTLRAVVHHPEPREITVVEIDPRVVEAARAHFAPFNERALDDPRVRVVTNDGRNFMDAGGGRFDVITSEPPNIWVSGVSGLFTEEFYRAAANRLATNGVLCQWVPLYEMKRNDFRTMVHTIHTVFPNVAFWQVGTDVIVLASPDPFKIELPQVVARLRSPALARDFSAVGLTMRGVVELMNSPAVRPDQVDTYLGRVDSLNRDDRPILEFNTARNLFDVAKDEAKARARAQK